MGIEIQILDWIQGLRTPAGDVFMPVITSLGNVGIIWILLAVLQKNRSSAGYSIGSGCGSM